MRLLRKTLFLAAALWLPAAQAAPYIPADGSQVLERLPKRNDPARQAAAGLSSQLAADPENLPVAARLARLYIGMSRTDGDPRYLGYAQAVLRPWWDARQPPEEVLLLRATILQSLHQFPQALADLEAVLKLDRANGQAWLTRATVLTVIGNHADARASCARLHGLAPKLIVQTCLTNIDSVTGNARASYESLSAMLRQHGPADPGIRVWVLTLLAEMAARLGDDQHAESHFREALSTESADGYLLGAYADFLLDRGRAGEVVDLLQSKTRNDALLLRYALALKQQQSPEAAVQTENLRQRFAAAAMRGDTVHRREQARFELELAGAPKAAVETAKSNWNVQKEPADLRILLETGWAAGDKAAMREAMEWIAATHYQDKTMERLLARVAGKP